MMVRLIRLQIISVCAIFSAFAINSPRAAESPVIPANYTAVYDVLRNDKNLAEVTVQLSNQDGIWTMHGYTHSMQGLAGALNAKGAQTVTGNWNNGEFVPHNFKFSFSVIGYKSAWEADFDWPGETVTIRTKEGQFQLPLTGKAFDPLSLMLNTSTLLTDSQDRMMVNVIDEDEIKNHVYEADHDKPIDSALGCLKTTLVKRIRENSKRTSQVWYANDHEFVPVLMQHFKKKQHKGLRLEIKTLEVAGKPVQPAERCEIDKQEF
jgi:hypothetical protein